MATIPNITEEGNLAVTTHPHPPSYDSTSPDVFSQYLTEDGTSSGSNIMKVDGSSTPQEFYISSHSTKDTYIKCISILISDAGSTLNKFGNLIELSNGLSLVWSNGDTVTIEDNITTNFKLIRLSGGNPAYGDGSTAFRANNMSGASEGYLSHVDFSSMFGIPWGLRIRSASTEKLSVFVNDDITGLDEFNIKAFGLKL